MRITYNQRLLVALLKPNFQDFIGTLRHKHVLHEVIHQHIYKYK